MRRERAAGRPQRSLHEHRNRGPLRAPFAAQGRSYRAIGHPARRNYRQKKGAPTKRPTSRVAHNEICQSSSAIASALHASIRAQSPFLIQLLSSIQVPPTHITLDRAM